MCGGDRAGKVMHCTLNGAHLSLPADISNGLQSWGQQVDRQTRLRSLQPTATQITKSTKLFQETGSQHLRAG